MRKWLMMFGVVAIVGCGGGGDGGDGGGDGDGTNNGAAADECETDDDCPGDASAEFLHPENLVCDTDVDGRNYCAECQSDADCETGEACRELTYCEELGSCNVGTDCQTDGVFHDACVMGYCRECLSNFDCEGGETCYNRRCAPEDDVAPTCLDASCENCVIVTDDAGDPTGVECRD